MLHLPLRRPKGNAYDNKDKQNNKLSSETNAITFRKNFYSNINSNNKSVWGNKNSY